jgi:hypothetical protein
MVNELKITNWKLKILLIIFISFTFSVLRFTFAQNANAQTPSSYDVTVSPIYFDLSADPGTSITSKVRIRNNTTSSIPLKLGIEKLTGDINGNVTLKQDKNDYTLSWIKFDSDSIVVKPLEWTEVPFTINIPKDAAYGYYWTITMAQDKTNPLAKSAVNLTGAAGIPVLLNVRKEGAKAEAKVLGFSTGNFISEYLPVDFTVKVENFGNVHVKPHGNIFISGTGNKNLAVLDVNSTLGNIIPNSSRIFNASWSDGFLVKELVFEDGQPKLDKNGKQLEKITINWNKLTEFRIGKYTATLLLVYDNGKKDVPLEQTISFWIIPYKVIGGVLITLLVAFFVTRWAIKAYISHEINKRLKA